MVEGRAPAPTPALLTSRGRDRLFHSPSQDVFVLRLPVPEQLPPKNPAPCRVVGAFQKCSVGAVFPLGWHRFPVCQLGVCRLPPTRAQPLHLAVEMSSSHPSKLHLVFLCRSPAKAKGCIWREARGSTRKALGFFLAHFPKKQDLRWQDAYFFSLWF